MLGIVKACLENATVQKSGTNLVGPAGKRVLSHESGKLTTTCSVRRDHGERMHVSYISVQVERILIYV
jgi:hypothetical protein